MVMPVTKTVTRAVIGAVVRAAVNVIGTQESAPV
jgi:hypothetical protein